MNYECSHCSAPIFIPNSAAWPQQCPTCRIWHPGFRSPGFAKMIYPGTSVIAPGCVVQVPL